MKSLFITTARMGALAGLASVLSLKAQTLIPGDENWFVFERGLEGEGAASAVGGRYLYLGGRFTNVNGSNDSANFARFDLWKEVLEPIPGLDRDLNGVVLEVHLADGLVYIGGNFSSPDGVTASRVAVYNPNTESFSGLIGSPSDLVSTGQENGPTTGDVRAILKVGNLVYVGGMYGGEDGIGEPDNEKHIRVFNLSTNRWSRLGNGVGTLAIHGVFALAQLPDGSILAGGAFPGGLSRWDGTAWSTYAGGANDTVRAIQVAPDGNVYVGGFFTEVGSGGGAVDTNFIARYNTKTNTWDGLAGGFDEDFVGTTADGVFDIEIARDGRVYVAGQFESTDSGSNTNLRNMAFWDGTGDWQNMGSGIGTETANIVNTLAIDETDGDIFVSGSLRRGFSTNTSGAGRHAIWNEDVDFKGDASGVNFDYWPGARGNLSFQIVELTDDEVTVSVETGVNVDYFLESSPTLGSSANWTTLGFNVRSNRGLIQFTRDRNSTSGTEFFRLRSEDPF